MHQHARTAGGRPDFHAIVQTLGVVLCQCPSRLTGNVHELRYHRPYRRREYARQTCGDEDAHTGKLGKLAYGRRRRCTRLYTLCTCSRDPPQINPSFILNGLSNARAISQPFWGWKRHARPTARTSASLLLVRGDWNAEAKRREHEVVIGWKTPWSQSPSYTCESVSWCPFRFKWIRIRVRGMMMVH